MASRPNCAELEASPVSLRAGPSIGDPCMYHGMYRYTLCPEEKNLLFANLRPVRDESFESARSDPVDSDEEDEELKRALAESMRTTSLEPYSCYSQHSR